LAKPILRIFGLRNDQVGINSPSTNDSSSSSLVEKLKLSNKVRLDVRVAEVGERAARSA
jgi:hypothetical protein